VAGCSMPGMDTNEQGQGLFWDMLAGRVAPPPSAATLGWELIDLDPEQGEIEVAFEAGEQFTNPGGAVQGGFLAAMLDDAMGPALAALLSPNQFAPTLDLHVQYLRPARPGRFVGRGRVVQRGKEVCFLAGELFGADGKTVAVSTATARIQMMP
jgi:uncharacterized protein (TIGR00369 family)